MLRRFIRWGSTADNCWYLNDDTILLQGIIEDLTQTSQDTGSVTLEKDDDQFNSDIDELNEEDLDNQFIQVWLQTLYACYITTRVG